MADAPDAPAPTGSPRPSMLREGGKLGLLTLLSRVLGLAREMTRAAFLGTSGLADAFGVAFSLPNFLRRLFAENSVTAAFVPTFTGYLAEGESEAARARSREFLSATFTVLVFLVSLTVALGIALAPLIVRLFSTDPGETAVLTRIMFPFLALVSVAALLQGILNSIGVFTPSGLAPVAFNLAFIALPYAIAGFMPNPARAMAVGVVLGGLLQALVQLPAVLRAGWGFGFMGLRRAFRNPGMRRVLKLIGPTILGMAAYQLNALVSTSLASGAGTGAVSSLQYSLRLQELVLGVFVVSAGTVLLPNLSASAQSRDWAAFSASVSQGLKAMLLVTIPVAAYSMVMGTDIVTLLFRSREFGDESVALTASAFFWHMTGLVFIAMNRVFAPAFYACADTKAPTRAGLISVVVNVAAAYVLVGPLRGPGIALALSIASAVNTLVLVILLSRKKIGGMPAALAKVLGYAAKITALSIVAALPLWLLLPRLDGLFASHESRFMSVGLPLVVSALAFGLVVLGLLVLARDEMAKALFAALARRSRGGRRHAKG